MHWKKYNDKVILSVVNKAIDYYGDNIPLNAIIEIYLVNEFNLDNETAYLQACYLSNRYIKITENIDLEV